MISGIVNMVGFSMLNDRINEDRKRNEERREEENKEGKFKMTPEQISEYQSMKLNYSNYQADSLVLDKMYKTLLQAIPTKIIINHLQGRKDFNKKWRILQK